MDRWSELEFDRIVKNVSNALENEFEYSDVWSTFFELMDEDDKLDIDELFVDFISYTAECLLIEYIEDEEDSNPCHEEMSDTEKRKFLLPLERLMKNVSCLKNPFSEHLLDASDEEGCEDVFREYTALVIDENCFIELKDRIKEEVLKKDPEKKTFEERARKWKFSSIKK